jgi:hypothetical protein
MNRDFKEIFKVLRDYLTAIEPCKNSLIMQGRKQMAIGTPNSVPFYSHRSHHRIGHSINVGMARKGNDCRSLSSRSRSSDCRHLAQSLTYMGSSPSSSTKLID